MIEAWRVDYHEARPHGSLGDLTPAEFAAKKQAAVTMMSTPEPHISLDQKKG